MGRDLTSGGSTTPSSNTLCLPFSMAGSRVSPRPGGRGGACGVMDLYDSCDCSVRAEISELVSGCSLVSSGYRSSSLSSSSEMVSSSSSSSAC